MIEERVYFDLQFQRERVPHGREVTQEVERDNRKWGKVPNPPHLPPSDYFFLQSPMISTDRDTNGYQCVRKDEPWMIVLKASCPPNTDSSSFVKKILQDFKSQITTKQ